MSQRPVCANCHREIPCGKTGVWVVHFDDAGYEIEVLRGDRYDCACGAKVVVGWGRPVQRHEAGFADATQLAKDDTNTVWLRK